MNKSKNKILLIILALLIFISCSNVKTVETNLKNNQNIESQLNNSFASNEDPWEPLNRRVYYFNYVLDKYLVLPITDTYKFITPDFIENRVTNFFRNIGVLNTTANAALQTKGRKSMRALARFTINTVLGLGGIFDVASHMGMPKPYEDFGLTLAHYGVPRGPYLVLPLLGPSYLRDTFGLVAETAIKKQMDPYRHMELFDLNSIEVTALQGIDKRKNTSFRYYSTTSPFEYEYLRFLFSKYRKFQEETGVKMF